MRIRLTAMVILLCLLQAPLPVPAQDNPLVFSHLKEEDGLSSNIINCFLKDRSGNLWVGTYDGFNRYDGSGFFRFRKRKGNNSMGNEVVHSLCEDTKGNIWGSTDNGVFCFQPATDQFTNYNLQSYGQGRTLFNIICDQRGDVWAGAEWSVFRFNRNEGKFEETIKIANDGDSLPYFRLRKNGLLADPAGKGIWISTRSGIFFYDLHHKKLEGFHSSPADSLFKRRSTSALSLSPTGKLWFFDNEQRRIIQFDPASKKILQSIYIGTEFQASDAATIFEDQHQRLWLSGWSYELFILDLANGNRIRRLKHQPGDDRSIAGEFFWSAMQDEDGTIWLGTVNGISRSNPEKNIYKEYHLPERIPELATTSISIAEEDPVEKTIWIQTRSGLLVAYNPANGNYKLFDINNGKPNQEGLKPGVVNTIRFVNDRTVITTNTGAWQIRKGTSSLVPYDLLPAGYTGFKCAELQPDGDSVLYFNNGKELLYWNRLTQATRLLRYPPDPAMPADKTIITGLRLSSDHKPWVISYNNHLAYGDKDQLVRVKIIRDEIKETGTLINIETGENNTVWLLNKGAGLYRFDPVTAAIRIWDQTDGLQGNRMHMIKADRAGRIWSMLYNKVSVFFPGSQRFYNFSLPISESNLSYYNHLSSLSNGNLFGSINNEIIEFFPDRVGSIPAKRKPNISQLSINGGPFRLVTENKVLLQPSENTLRLGFGILIDRETFPYQLEYMLEGAEKTWTLSTGNDEAIYNNLPSGKYKFRVKARGNNDAWESDEAVLLIHIQTPFYKTTWFNVLIAALIIAALFLLYRYRLFKQRQILTLETKAQQLEKEKAMVLYEGLKQQLNPHFLFNSLTSLSGLIETNQEMAGAFLEQMSGIYRYILKNGDRETVSLQDEIGFAKLYIDLQKTRFKNGLQVNIDVPEEQLHYKIAPVTLQNMIENAIKHNIIDTGSPLVIDIFSEEEYLVVRNNLQPKMNVETSNKRGLAQFVNLYGYLSDQPVIIEESHQYFSVKIPLI